MICPKCKLDTLNEEKNMVVCSKCGFKATLFEYNVWMKAKPQRLSAFQRFLRTMFGISSKTLRVTKKRTSKGFECPKCGSSPQRGHLVSSGHIIWSDNTILGINPLEHFGLGMMRRERFPIFRHPFSLEAYRCRTCGIIYIDEFQLLAS